MHSICPFRGGKCSRMNIPISGEWRALFIKHPFFFQMHHQRLPFNWKCPTGYLIAVALQWISLTYIFYSAMIVTTYGIAGYLFVTAVTEDIKCTLNTIDEILKTKTTSKLIFKQFTGFVQLFSTIKQLSALYSSTSVTIE